MKKYFIILLFFMSCSSRIKNSEQDFPYDAVEVKSSGGFTGISTGFVIQKNAEILVLYHQPGKSFNQKFYRSSTLDSVYKMFTFLESSKILNATYNKPGNLTYSITVRKDSTTKSIYWSDGQDSIQNYIKVYNTLRNFASGRRD